MPPKRAAAVAAAEELSSAHPKRTKTSSSTAAKATSATKTKGTAASKAAKAAKSAAANTSAKRKPAAKSKAAAKSTSTKSTKEKVAAAAPSKNNVKRKAEEESDDEPAAKKTKTAAKEKSTTKAPAKPKAPPRAKPAVKAPPKKIIINKCPTVRLDVFVFGEGSAGELGLGSAKRAIDVKRPRLNPNLAADTVGIVSLATGGMHNIALTHDNKIMTWGVNDQGALGRNTHWDGGLRDVNSSEDSDSDDDPDGDSGLNPLEATPTAISQDAFPEGTTFVQVAAADSASFALTDDGLVYGWGTFRNNEGIFGFSRDGKNVNIIQTTPVLIPKLKKITSLCTGANHALALDNKGNVYAWGTGQQMQLGRRIVERSAVAGLDPTTVAVKKIKTIASGSYHSFAIDANDKVWTWGLNSYGETGITEGAGGDSAVIPKPTVAHNLSGKGLQELSGGSHHSAGVTDKGECFVWGRMDGGQMGIKSTDLAVEDEDMIKKDEAGRARILLQPTQVPGINANFVTCGPEHCIAITDAGKAYSWGFNANYQLGLGHGEDVDVATLIDNTATREKALNWAGAGGQFSVLTAPAS